MKIRRGPFGPPPSGRVTCQTPSGRGLTEEIRKFERINSVGETNVNFDLCNSCKGLGTSRLHELHDWKFPFVPRIEFIRSKLSIFFAHVSRVPDRRGKLQSKPWKWMTHPEAGSAGAGHNRTMENYHSPPIGLFTVDHARLLFNPHHVTPVLILPGLLPLPTCMFRYWCRCQRRAGTCLEVGHPEYGQTVVHVAPQSAVLADTKRVHQPRDEVGREADYTRLESQTHSQSAITQRGQTTAKTVPALISTRQCRTYLLCVRVRGGGVRSRYFFFLFCTPYFSREI